jgi:septum site-determining protein MinD
MTRIISILSGKGGVGKTTVVINLATALVSKFNKDVIIVDCNVTASHLGLYLGMYYCPITLNEVLKEEAKITDAIYDHHTQVKIIPSSLRLTDLKGVDITKLKDLVKELSGVDFILLDSAPGLGREALSAVQASNEAIFVTTPYIPSTIDVIRCNEMVKKLEIGSLGIVLNMVGNEKHELNEKEIERLAELPVLASIPLDKNIPKSLASREPLIVYEPNSSASRGFMRLSARLIGEKYEIGFLEKLKRFLKI